MPEYPKFSIAFNIGSTNEERSEAFRLYEQAFGAVKISEIGPPDWPDIHITMEINGLKVLLAPGGKAEKVRESTMVCEFLFDDEIPLRKAYDILIREGTDYHIGSYPWAATGAFVIDKFGIHWWLHR